MLIQQHEGDLKSNKIKTDVCRRLGNGVHTTCIHSDWRRNTDRKRTPVAVNCVVSSANVIRNLPQNLTVATSVENSCCLYQQCFISKSASIFLVDSVLRSCLLMLSWVVSGYKISPTSNTTHFCYCTQSASRYKHCLFL